MGSSRVKITINKNNWWKATNFSRLKIEVYNKNNKNNSLSQKQEYAN